MISVGLQRMLCAVLQQHPESQPVLFVLQSNLARAQLVVHHGTLRPSMQDAPMTHSSLLICISTTVELFLMCLDLAHPYTIACLLLLLHACSTGKLHWKDSAFIIVLATTGVGHAIAGSGDVQGYPKARHCSVRGVGCAQVSRA